MILPCIPPSKVSSSLLSEPLSTRTFVFVESNRAVALNAPIPADEPFPHTVGNRRWTPVHHAASGVLEESEIMKLLEL